MRHHASEKTEIIRLVEQSPWPARRTLDRLGIPRSSFYRWYDRYRRGGPEALADRLSRPDRVWNRIPEAIRSQIVELALDQPELSPRELAVRFTDEEKYFVSEASVYRLLKAHDLIASPAYIVIKAAEAFKHKTSAPNQLWQTDFTYLKITGWGWYYLSTVLDDFSRFIVAWKLCATMKTQDVTATLDLALAASGLDQATVVHRPRLLSDNGASYLAQDLAKWLDQQKMEHVRSAPYHPQTQGKIERWHQTLKNRILLEHYYLPGDLERQLAAFVARYNHARHTRASTISLRQTSTSDGPRPSSSNAKGSNARPSPIAVCSTNCVPHNLKPQTIQSLPSGSQQTASNHLTTDTLRGGASLYPRGSGAKLRPSQKRHRSNRQGRSEIQLLTGRDLAAPLGAGSDCALPMRDNVCDAVDQRKRQEDHSRRRGGLRLEHDRVPIVDRRP